MFTRKKQGRSLAKLQKTGDAFVFDPDLAWYLQSSDAALGERSTMASLLTMIEFGIPTGGGDPDDRYNDAHLGWGKVLVGAVERARMCDAAWKLVVKVDRDVLSARYLLVQGKLPPGIHGGLGELGGIAMLLALRDGKLERLMALSETAKKTSGQQEKIKLWKPWRTRAERANLQAHASWLLARAESEAA